MNKFKIINGFEQEFEEVWKTRDTLLDKVPGFLRFNLIKGKKGDEFTLYASHSLWDSEIRFIGKIYIKLHVKYFLDFFSKSHCCVSKCTKYTTLYYKKKD